MADLLNKLAALIEAEKAESRTKADSDRLDRIEEQLTALAKKGAPDARDVRELAEELAARPEFRQLVEDEERWLDEQPDDEEPPAGDGDGTEPPPTDEPPDEERWPRYRRVQTSIGRLWSGDDEPDHVEFYDEEGKVSVRDGRKRNLPVFYDLEEVERQKRDEDEPSPET